MNSILDLNNAKPLITIITVSMNDAVGLEKTITSIINQDYLNLQYIVIDGASIDDTPSVLSRFESKIDIVLVETDVGVYHAMNKGISLAVGEWLLFMNAGDVFYNNLVLSEVEVELQSNVDVVYADWVYQENGKRVSASIEKLNVRHQSVIYRRNLHDIYGNYVVGHKVTISDFIFFQSIAHLSWKYFPTPISTCQQAGLSAKPAHFYQRILSEGVFGRRNRISVAAILTLYPAYRFIKKSILKLKRI